jgi:hypothetical protein
MPVGTVVWALKRLESDFDIRLDVLYECFCKQSVPCIYPSVLRTF